MFGNKGGFGGLGGMSQVLEMLQQLGVDEIRKAGGVGYQTPAGLSDETYSALTPQDLSANITMLVHELEDLVLWNSSPKGKATQPLTEFIRQTGFSGNRSLGFFGETGRPSFGAGKYGRGSELIRQQGAYGFVSMLANASKMVVASGTLAQARKDAMRTALMRTERGLLKANSNLAPSQYRGIKQQIQEDDGVVVDLRGAELSLDEIEERLGELRALARRARPTGLHLSTEVCTDLSRSMAEYGRRAFDGQGVRFGISDISIKAGANGKDVPLIETPFLDRDADWWPLPVAAEGEAPPAAPAVAVQPGAAANASSRFIAADAGTYRYAVVANSERGASAPLLLDPVLVAAGESVTFDLNDVAIKTGSDEDAVTYYDVFRTSKNGTNDHELVAQVPVNTLAGGGQTRIVDHHERVHGTTDGLVMTMRADEFEIRQLLPLMYLPLPQVNTQLPFIIMHFIAPVMKATQRFALIKNIGRRGGRTPIQRSDLLVA